MGPKRKAAASDSTTHLVFQEGTSHKFWKITVDGSSTTVNYGKVGTSGQNQEKEHKDEAAAEKFASKEIAGKKKKGYEDAEGGSEEPEPAQKATKKAKPAPEKAPSKKAVAKKAAASAPSSSDSTTHLVFQEGTSHKFWKITVNGSSTTVNYGKVGTSGMTSEKEHKDEAAAEKFATKEVAGKKKKGYENAEGSGTAGSSSSSSSSSNIKSNARRWAFVVLHYGSGAVGNFEVFSSRAAYMALPRNIREDNYGSLSANPPYGLNVIETLDEAKKRLDAIIKCGSADKASAAKGTISAGPIYKPSNFVESTETSDLYCFVLKVNEEAEFVFVFDSSEAHEAFQAYFNEKWGDPDEDEEKEWLRLCAEEFTANGVWTLEMVKAASEDDLGEKFNN